MPERWHIDEDCERALTQLNDALCTFERGTGRQYLLVLIPEQPDEGVHVSQGGKPMAMKSVTYQEIKMFVANALGRRG